MLLRSCWGPPGIPSRTPPRIPLWKPLLHRAEESISSFGCTNDIILYRINLLLVLFFVICQQYGQYRKSAPFKLNAEEGLTITYCSTGLMFAPVISPFRNNVGGVGFLILYAAWPLAVCPLAFHWTICNMGYFWTQTATAELQNTFLLSTAGGSVAFIILSQQSAFKSVKWYLELCIPSSIVWSLYYSAQRALSVCKEGRHCFPGRWIWSQVDQDTFHWTPTPKTSSSTESRP